MGQRVFKRGAAVVAVLALVSAMLGVVSSSPSVAADCGERVLLVAGSSPAPAGDAALVDALAGRSPGASCVVVVDDDVVTVAQAEGFDVVVIASSVLPLRLGDRLVDAQVPVLVSEPFLFDDMAMTVGTGKELVGRTSVKITDGSHRLAGGLSGTVTVLETAAKVNYGVDGRAPGIEAVANTGGSSPRMTIFGFAAGAELTDRVAAAGRVGFFASYGADLTDDGTTLFNAAIDWLVGQGGDGVACGMVVTTDLVLDQDLLDCPGKGLVVGADGITIDLNGHTIGGSAASRAAGDEGVSSVGFDRVTVRNGTIRDFFYGIEIISSANDVIEDMVFSDNAGSVEMVAVRDSVIHGNTSTSASFWAVRLARSARNVVRDNTSDNSRYGVVVFGGADNEVLGNDFKGGSRGLNDGVLLEQASAGTIVSDNSASGFSYGVRADDASTDALITNNATSANTVDGIFVAADVLRTTIRGNSANDNGEWGIRALSAVVDGGGNTATGNGTGSCSGVVCNVEPPPRALFVAGNSSPPPGDRDIVDIIEGAGVEVTVVDDDSDLSTLVASDYDVVVVSTSVVPSKVGDLFVDVLVPVVIWEPFLFDDMAMTERGPRETSATYRDVTIVDATHPLADGLPVGDARVYDVARTLSYGAAAEAAEIVAHVPGRSSQDVMFVLDPGDVRADGSPSPALRVGLFPTYPGGLRLSDQGKALIASAVEWVLAGGPPGNDDFADRFTLTGSIATGDNVGATQEDGEPDHWSDPMSSVWWQWTATIDGGAVIDTNGSGFDTVLAVFEGAELSSLTQLDADDDGGEGAFSEVRFAIKAGETYHVVVDGYGGAQGDYVLNVVEQARPVNDDFADRLPLGYGSVVTTNVGATVELGEPEASSGALHNTLWWTWTAPSDGMFVFDTSGSDPDTVVTLWTGDELATLLEGPWSGQVDAVEGTTYQVSVGSWDSSGLVQLNVLGAEGVVGSVLPIAAHWSLEMVLDDDGYPVIGYSEWETSSNERTAKLIHCNDPLCEGGDDEPVVIASSASVAGLALDASGSPVMVIAEGVIGKLVHCNDPGCLGDDETISTLPHRGDLALDEAGFPVIATTGGGELRVTRCNDPDCAGGDERTEVVDEPRADSRLSGGSLALDRNGFPVLAYSDYTSWEEGVNASVKVARCNDRFCAGGDESIVEFGSSENVPDPGLVLDDSDRPIVVYTDDSFIFSGVVLVSCVDLTCADRAETGIGDFSFSRGNTVGIGPGDRPIVGYTYSEGDGLSIAVCRSDDCSAQSLVYITPPGDWDGISGLVLSVASDGTPVLAFTSWDRSADIDTLVLARLVGLRFD